MKKMLIALFLVIGLAGCASSSEYKLYLDSQTAIEVAKHTADAEKYKALATIAVSGDSTSKVAAVMAMASGSTTTPTTKVQGPVQNGTALQWASVLVPGLTQVAGLRYNYMALSEQSKNNAAVAISTNSTFAEIASNIPSSVVTTTTTTTDNSQVLSGTGNLGTGSYSNIDDHGVTSTIVPPVVQIVPVINSTP